MKEPESLTPVEDLSRPQAIERLRSNLRLLTDEEHCACAAAARFGVLSKGVQSSSKAEYWTTRSRASRQELERLVSIYHRGRQELTGAAVCCELETRDHCGCWNMIGNKKLEEFHRELTGRRVRIR